jgi:hypothetical protein
MRTQDGSGHYVYTVRPCDCVTITVRVVAATGDAIPLDKSS